MPTEKGSEKLVASNRKARHEYFIEETYEAARQLDDRIRGFYEAFRGLKEEGSLPSSSDEDRESA